MINEILQTYASLISCRRKAPGMRLEDAFNDDALKSFEAEYAWLLKVQEELLKLERKMDK